MSDDLTERSDELGRKIEELKHERETPTPQQLREQAAAEHARENGTGLNSGKAGH